MPKNQTPDLSHIADKPLDMAEMPAKYATGYYAFIRRPNGTVYTNVPHYVVHHSPNGFEIGYPGSGPADLALNLAEDSLRRMGYDEPGTVHCFSGTCSSAAWDMHQTLKRDIVATMARDWCVLKHSYVDEWVRTWLARNGYPVRAKQPDVQALTEGEPEDVLAGVDLPF